MNDKDVQTITRVILTIGIVLCGLSLILPWGELTVGMFGIGDFYTWGVQISLPSNSELTLYFSILSESSPFSQQLSSYLIEVFFSILVLPLGLLSLALGIIAEIRLAKYGKDLSLRAGVFSIVAVVFFYIFIQFGMLRAYEPLTAFFDWSMGFYMMIISAMLFFGSYVILRNLVDEEGIEKTPNL